MNPTITQTAEAAELARLNKILNVTDEAPFDDITLSVVRNPLNGRIVSQDGMNSDDTGLVVKFDTESVLDKGQTYEAGHPVYIDMEFVTIVPPGKASRNLVVRSPVTEYYKWRFATDYENWKKGRSAQQSGTPLTMWPAVGPAQIKELEHLNVYTIEQFAGLPDSNANTIRGFYGLKAKAKEFLATAEKASANGALHAELSKRDEQIATLQTQLAALLEAQNVADRVEDRKVKSASR